MAYSTTQIDENRGSNSITLPAQLSQDVWAKAVEQSAIMQLAQRVDLPGNGIAIPVVTGDVSADWITESTEKHVGKATYSLKTMTPYKLAVIECFSDEFRRDLPGLYAELARRLPAAIGRKLDYTIFQGTAPGTGFDVLTNSTAVSIDADASENVYQKLVNAYGAIAAGGFDFNGIAASPQAYAKLLGAVGSNGEPLFRAELGTGEVLGAKVVGAKQAYVAGSPATIGFAGDWSQARYGIVEGIKVSISDQATVNDGTNQINLWQRNMFAVRVEAEVGFVVANSSAFVKLTGTVAGATGATA